MKKIVRWQGIVLFLAFGALLAVLWSLFVDKYTERTIEKSGTMIVGARVELDKADVKLSPVGITLKRLQVTNPDRPMTNAVEVGRIAFHMDSLNALRRKVIIEEMSIEDVQLNTPRKTSGALTAAEKAEREEIVQAITGLPSLVAANVKEIFEKEKDNLETLRLISSTLDKSRSMRSRWEQRIREIKEAADVEEYKARIAKIKETEKGTLAGLLGGGKEVLALQKDLRADIEAITGAKTEFESDFTAVKQAVGGVPSAIQGDARRLVEKYSLSPAGLANISQALFGEQIAGRVRTALKWRERLDPLVQRIKEKHKGKEVVRPLRAQGMNVRFREDNPLPDFLIRLAHVSVSLPAGRFEGTLENFTPDQDIHGRPVTFRLSGENMKGLKSASLEGIFNRVNPDAAEDSLTLSIRGYEARDIVLSKNDAFPVSLTEGLVNLDIGATFLKDRISVKVDAGLSSIQLAVEPREENGEIFQALRSAILGVSNFNISAEVAGAPDDFTVSLRSDLDGVLKSAVNSLVSAQAERLEKELRKVIDSHIADPLENLTSSVAGLDVLNAELDNLRGELEKLLSLKD